MLAVPLDLLHVSSLRPADRAREPDYPPVDHDLIDVLLGRRNFVDHPLVLAADHPGGLRRQVGLGESVLGNGPAHPPRSRSSPKRSSSAGRRRRKIR